MGKKRVERTRAAGTMTEAMFWSWIRSVLRQKSRWWKPISIARIKARRKYSGPNKRQKYEYQCAECKQWFPDKKISVDHIIPAGSLNCAEDLPGFVQRLFCEVEGLQVLCEDDHTLKTNIEKNGKLSVPNKRKMGARTGISGKRRRAVKPRRISKRAISHSRKP